MQWPLGTRQSKDSKKAGLVLKAAGAIEEKIGFNMVG